MASLGEIVDGLVEEAGGFAIDTPDDWAQGRTLYGGMTAALCAASVARAVPALPPLRSSQFTFVGPASGRLLFRPTLLRQGRSVTILSVQCEGVEGLAAQAIFAYGGARESEVRYDTPPFPAVRTPDECDPFFKPGGSQPGFAKNFEIRREAGALPRSNDPEPVFCAWVRLREPTGVDPIFALFALGDSLPPAAMVQFTAPGPISTLTWSLDFQPPVPPTGWCLVRSTGEQAQDGYSLQGMEIWNREGRRIAAGRQVVSVFR